jgi:hypothetical protein
MHQRMDPEEWDTGGHVINELGLGGEAVQVQWIQFLNPSSPSNHHCRSLQSLRISPFTPVLQIDHKASPSPVRS